MDISSIQSIIEMMTEFIREMARMSYDIVTAIAPGNEEIVLIVTAIVSVYYLKNRASSIVTWALAAFLLYLVLSNGFI